MTSYQKRKENIAYLEQCVKELEIMVRHFAKYAPPDKRQELIDFGITKNSFLTPYSCPEAFNGGFMAELEDL